MTNFYAELIYTLELVIFIGCGAVPNPWVDSDGAVIRTQVPDNRPVKYHVPS